MFEYYYTLESKGIQEFIFRGNRLKSAVGGSEIIDNVPDELIGKLLDDIGCIEKEDYIWLSKAAGGARLLLKDKEVRRYLCKAVPIAASVYAPGLTLVQAVADFGEDSGRSILDVMNTASEMLPERRKELFAQLPPAGPLVERCRRTGLPAVSKDSKEGYIDEPMMMMLRNAPAGQKGLISRVLPESADIKYPVDMEELTGSENGRVAVIHCDANGLGSVLKRFLDNLKGFANKEDTVKIYRVFCAAVQKATEKSLKTALEPFTTLDCATRFGNSYFYPVRPLICAGDDVTIIIRSRYAIEFMDRFLSAFEENTEEEFTKKVELPSGKAASIAEVMARKNDNPDTEKVEPMLTACGGAAFVSGHFPFYQAYEMCESLCSYAKNKTNRKASAAAFRRITTSTTGDFDDVLTQELTIRGTDGNTVLTMMPYATGRHKDDDGVNSPSLDDLLKLKNAVNEMPRGSMRQLINEMYAGREYAVDAFKRIIEVGVEKDKSKNKDMTENMLKALRKITGFDPNIPNKDGRELFTKPKKVEGINCYYTPIGDVIDLLSEER
ncbi:MAG: hypothetical protein HUJ86_01920 [Synergistes sp.]|nr:hypothetical protein [Synergistes sp.]